MGLLIWISEVAADMKNTHPQVLIYRLSILLKNSLGPSIPLSER